MNQPEADVIAWASYQLGQVLSVLNQIARGEVGGSISSQPAKPAAPTPTHVPHRAPAPRKRHSPAARVGELEATPVPACDLARDYAGLGHGSHHDISVQLTRAVYAAERIAPVWVDLGGEG